MKRHTIILTVMLCACSLPPTAPDREPATSCDVQAMAPWVLSCIENANPHSDEEPEDYVRQCESTAAHLFCGAGCSVTGVDVQRVMCDVAPPIGASDD